MFLDPALKTKGHRFRLLLPYIFSRVSLIWQKNLGLSLELGSGVLRGDC